jgi:hypothetical protein
MEKIDDDRRGRRKPLPRRLVPGDGRLNQGDPVGDKIE